MSQCFASLPMARTLHRSHCHECGAGTCVRRVITIHNNPENMQLPGSFKHLRLQLADVDTQDVSKFFAPSYTFIEEARAANEGVHIWTQCPVSTHYPWTSRAYCLLLLGFFVACVFGTLGLAEICRGNTLTHCLLSWRLTIPVLDLLLEHFLDILKIMFYWTIF